MNNADKAFLTLVRYAVGGDGCREEMQGKTIDWGCVFSQAMAQSIPALVADGLQAYLTAHSPSSLFASESIVKRQNRLKWIGNVVVAERQYANHRKLMADLARFYESKGIPMMVLKGYGLSLDWPVPSHRSVGDLDIYLFGQQERADGLLREQGVRIDEDHEHHTIFKYQNIPVENHYDFINVHAHRDAPEIEKQLKELSKYGNKEILVEAAKITLPSADFNALFLMRHMGQHFAGEHLNMRQVLDWGFFVRSHTSEIDWIAAVDRLRAIGLYTFFNQINAICVDYLGFNEDIFPPIKRQESLESRILKDILHPEFAESKPLSGLMPILVFKWRRWWHNRWKHPLVYDEWWLPMLLTLIWSHLRRWRTIMD